MLAYQIITSTGHCIDPTGFECMNIFPTLSRARAYKKYLENEVYAEEKFKIVEVDVNDHNYES